MFKSILIPTDGSSLSDKAVRQGLELARALGSKVVALHVTPPFHVLAATPAALTATREQREQHAAAFNKEVFERVAAAAREAGVGLHLFVAHRRTRMAADHHGRGSQWLRCDLHGVSRT
jgi:nucleotide-binding universal stress UspA family protein